MMVSLKVSFFVYQNVAPISSPSETSYALELDSYEKEDVQELEDSEKINQEIVLHTTCMFSQKLKHFSIHKLDYRVFYLEFSSPPPEVA